MRLVFAGTPRFAAVALDALLAAGHEVVLVLTQPDRPAGRGLQATASEVKRLALAHGLKIEQPQTLRTPDAAGALRATGAEMMVVAAYGLILPQAVLDAFPRGCVNIHASLLPRWRGAAPIQRAILAGDARTGISIMQMEAGLDTGPVLVQVALDIAADETAGSLHDRLAELGGRAIVDGLAALAAGTIEPTPQDDSLAVYAPKIGRPEAAVRWSESAEVIERQIRAFDPVPGAHARFNGEAVKIWRAHGASGAQDGAPGEVLSSSERGIEIACGGGTALALTVLQRPGGKRLAVGDFLRGHAVAVGSRFEDGA
ncbi:MAG: methionyl-tRNA formyltransferase [Burkholderiales bacterium]|nr:methionyl-tRNA formyltransferase [Burkholderiales bacterium]